MLSEALADYEADLVVFTAHSLPERIAREGDDYPGRLAESCGIVAAGMTLPAWRWAFQSASATGEQ